MALTIEQARTRVARGAAYLDRLFNGWANHVDVNTLDMGLDCHCVLGQLDGSFCDAAEKLWPVPRLNWFQRLWELPDSERPWRMAEALGFDAPESSLRAEESADFALLQDVWVEAIADRRISTTVTQPEQEPVCAK